MRLLLLVTVQQRRERLNRQINERLRTLIAAYKVLGGSFTGELTVDPTHLRDLRLRDRRRRAAAPGAGDGPPGGAEGAGATEGVLDLSAGGEGAGEGSDRTRRIRDAVEAALSDVILLGTEAQVRLAAGAARELASGRPVHTRELVVSLRDFIRDALDLDPIPRDVAVPSQGPARPSGSGGRGRGEGGPPGARQGGGGGGELGGAGMGGGGMGAGMGLGMTRHAGSPDEPAAPGDHP